MLKPADLLSSNFRAYEFAERVGQSSRLPDSTVLCHNIAKLACEGLQPLRKAWERAHTSVPGPATIKVICGWRSPEHNAAVGGAERSMHLDGLAADICCDVDWRALREGVGAERDAVRMEEFATFVEHFIDHGDIFGGFGVYTETTTGQCYWLHVDMRPRVNGHVAKWHGHHVGEER